MDNSQKKKSCQLNEWQKECKSVIEKCLRNEMTTLEAARQLCYTQRGIQKLIERYKAKGDAAFVHGNKNKKRINQETENRKLKIIDIITNATDDLGRRVFENISYAFCSQMLELDYGVKCSASWAKTIMNGLGFFTPIKHKIKNKTEHLFRERKEFSGELVQADGTPYDWFGDGKKYCIQGFVDDATGEPLGLYMTKNECLLGYIEAFRMMAAEYGIPEQLYPDRAGVFFVNVKGKQNEKTQFGEMMETLGVDMFPAYSPEAKGRIERFWETIQQQLPKLFRRYNIRTVEEANIFLRDIYRKRFKRLYAVKAKSEDTKFVKAPMEEINAVLVSRYSAKTDKGGVFSFKGYRFFCKDLPNEKIHIYLSEREGIYASPITKTERHEIKVVETDTSGRMPEVMKNLIEKTLLKNAKPQYKEVYLEIDDVALQRFSQRKKVA